MAQTSRLRRPPFTRSSAIRFVASATTRNNLPRTYVRLWHLADMEISLEMSAFERKADIGDLNFDVR